MNSSKKEVKENTENMKKGETERKREGGRGRRVKQEKLEKYV